MNRSFAVWPILFFVLASDARSVEPADFEYRTIQQADLDRVLTEWESRDLGAKNARTVYEQENDDYTLFVVQHELNSRAHFGAIVVPKTGRLDELPVAVIPDGLYQGSPTFDVEQAIEKYQSFAPLRGFIKILPGFRGRVVSTEEQVWFSRGDFCDAFDGATDDSIAMLNVAEQMFPDIDVNRVMVWGESRGGNVGLLMAVRDERVNTVIAIGAPTDFYRASWQVPDSDQYRCQFFDGFTEEAARQRMLASSPLLFAPGPNVSKVALHHDGGDEVVLAWNAHEIESHLKAHDVVVEKNVYPTDWHGAMVGEPEFWTNVEADIAEFLSRTTN